MIQHIADNNVFQLFVFNCYVLVICHLFFMHEEGDQNVASDNLSYFADKADIVVFSQPSFTKICKLIKLLTFVGKEGVSFHAGIQFHHLYLCLCNIPSWFVLSGTLEASGK